ncbi:MAG: heme exporter protein CcmB [Porticoccaceae bacterium]|nr:heme exporter protein CcmB [Porticoccaceae bacterium]|tara:strand:- start:67308 stop:68000 length:693 start_codon:yes stop_codon:yes gene_type:complete
MCSVKIRRDIGFYVYFRRELALARSAFGATTAPVLFMFMGVSLIPLALSSDTASQSSIAPGFVWIMVLLASLMSIERIFTFDYDDGSLEQMLISPQLLVQPIFGKVAAHWVLTGLPMSLSSPMMALVLSLPAEGYLPMMLSIIIGSAYLSLVGSVCASLTVSLGRGGFLLPITLIPLYMPIIIFGSATIDFAVNSMDWSFPLAVMGFLLCLAIAICPIAVAAILRSTLLF